MFIQQQRLISALFLVLTAMLQSVDSLALESVITGEHPARHQHINGAGQDYASNYRRYCIAALQDDAEAAYYLGWMHFNGHGMPVDDALAAGWFQLAAQRGDPHAQRILDDLLPTLVPAEDPGCPLRSKTPDRATIEAWVHVLAPSYGLDANLLLAVIEVESNFNPRAHSPKNARGLMQLIPATARRFEVKDSWDPFENLVGGITYLRWLLDIYDDDINLSLAAYNAGEHIVDRYGGIPPYTETRNYVKSINRIYNETIQPATISSNEIATDAMTATQ